MSDLVSITTPLARHPLECRFDSSDVPAFHQVFVHQHLRPLADVADVSLIVDCGAYVGYTSAYFLSRYPDATVIAIEADADNFALLARNLAPYGPRARPLRAAIWSHGCGLKSEEQPYRDGREWSRQVRECKPGEPPDVLGIAMDSILTWFGGRIAILKVDIEGAESVVFAGRCHSWLHRVDNIAIELHDDSQFARSTPVFLDAIAGEDFDTSNAGELTICRRRTSKPREVSCQVAAAGGPHMATRASLPLVSCLCPTFNRAPRNLRLLEEAVESFLRQDYPDKELVILNDTPGQVLRFDHPQVRIVNTPFRCATLGDKRNLLAALAHGELLCVWDDDDISLPWRLSTSVRLLGDADYYNAGAYWFLDAAGPHHDHQTGTSYFTSIYRKSVYQELGGTPRISMGEDFAMDEKLRLRRGPDTSPLPLDLWYYVYRWGSSPCHLSSVAGDSFYAEIGTRPIAQGEFRLHPAWEQDYVDLTRKYLSRLEAAQDARSKKKGDDLSTIALGWQP